MGCSGKGHETLYVVRELNAKRIWFAEALLSSNADEVRRLLSQARAWATQLGLPVHLWLSDKQDAFVTGIAAEFPESRIGIALIIFCATWRSPCWRRIITPRSRCAAQYAACVPSNARCCSNGAQLVAAAPAVVLAAESPAVVPAATTPVTPVPAYRRPRTSLPRPHRLRMPARSCWITLAPFVAYSMTIRVGRYNHRAYAWRRPWETSVLLSNVTSIPTVAAVRIPNSSAWPPVFTTAWPRCRQHTTSSVSRCKIDRACRGHADMCVQFGHGAPGPIHALARNSPASTPRFTATWLG